MLPTSQQCLFTGPLCRWASSHDLPDSSSHGLQSSSQLFHNPAGDKAHTGGNFGHPAREGGAPSLSLKDTVPTAKEAAVSNGAERLSYSHAASGGSHIFSRYAELPVLPAEAPTTNAMDKDLQQKLWRKKYDFGDADRCLSTLCILLHSVNYLVLSFVFPSP